MGVGAHTLSFGLQTYESQAVTATVTYMNQSSLSVLHTYTQANVQPGNVAIEWDGKADNGMWVAPGLYTIKLVLEDSIGNHVEEYALTTVQY